MVVYIKTRINGVYKYKAIFLKENNKQNEKDNK